MLTDEQESDLASFIEDDFGEKLTQDEFIDCCLQLFEDIAGFECLTDNQIQSVTTRIWSRYVERRNQVCNTEKS